MLSRAASAPLLLAASVGVPYVASNVSAWNSQLGTPAPTVAAADPAAAPGAPGAGAAAAAGVAAPSPAPATVAAPAVKPLVPQQGPGSTLFPNQTPLEGVPTYSIADVLRMDVSKDWVYGRWPRKSTALAELDLYGIRVPLVTGTKLHDLAGSLTYYFGADGRVKRISFRGRTGDTTQLAAIVHQRFGLQAMPTTIAGEQLLQYRDGDKVLSELRTRPAAVLWSSSPHESFAVELEIQDPATARPMVAPAPNSVAAPPPSQPAAVAAEAAKPQAGGVAQTAPQAAAKAPPPAAEQPKPLGWKAFFPRSRLPKEQVQNLDIGNLYQ
jgi:hypothetical protein